MTIEELIEQRLDRFDNLFNKAVGHTFREDEDYVNGENAKLKDERDTLLAPLLEKYNIKDIDDYYETYFNSNDKKNKKIDEIEEVLRKTTPKTSLYPYEKYCLEECRNLVHFIEDKAKSTGSNPRDYWNNILKVGNDIVNIVRNVEENGFEFDKDHSGNTMGSTILFTNCYIFNPELFQYMHGALAGLVGDEGYHDDRSDLPNINDIKKEKEEKV